MNNYPIPVPLLKLYDKVLGWVGITSWDRMAVQCPFRPFRSRVKKYVSICFIGVAIPPKRGSAVFWHNLKRSGQSDMAMLHGGCPVVLGSKWVANKWIREAANIFHRPCIKSIDF